MQNIRANLGYTNTAKCYYCYYCYCHTLFN